MSSLSHRRPQTVPAYPRAARPQPGVLADQLPRVLAQDHVVRGYVSLCDEIWASVLERLDHLEWFLDVDVAPITFVRWLGTWLGVTVDPALPEDRQRALVRTAGRTLRWRGTRWGLEQLLSALTGAHVEVVDDGGVIAGDEPSHATQRVSVRLAGAGGLSEAYLLEVIRADVPANAVIELEIAAEPVPEAPPTDDDAGSVLADPQPHGDEGFLPPMRGGVDDEWPDDPDA